MTKKVGLGTLKLPLTRRQYFMVTGGPFMECPLTMKGVKMAQEIDRTCVIDIPTVDFKTPPISALTIGLVRAVDLILDGQPVYVGCMGGKGRTGLFLAILAKAFGVESPVHYVRDNYYRHAVETSEQFDFVKSYQIPQSITWKLQVHRILAWAKVWKPKGNLTRLPAAS